MADPDTAFARAVKAGATVVVPVEDGNMGGALDGLSIRLDIIGRLGSRWAAEIRGFKKLLSGERVKSPTSRKEREKWGTHL